MRLCVLMATGETRIQVVEKMAPRLRRVLHFLPAAWGLMFAAPLLGRTESVTALTATIIAVLGAGAGAAIGRGIFALKSARSAQRVERLAADIAREAYEASKSGLLAPLRRTRRNEQTGLCERKRVDRVPSWPDVWTTPLAIDLRNAVAPHCALSP
jgi:hypothetical protein